MKAQASLHISSASQEHLLLDDNLPKIVSYPPGRINIVRFFLEDPFFNVSCFFSILLNKQAVVGIMHCIMWVIMITSRRENKKLIAFSIINFITFSLLRGYTYWRIPSCCLLAIF